MEYLVKVADALDATILVGKEGVELSVPQWTIQKMEKVLDNFNLGAYFPATEKEVKAA